ncbi:hypothetical protein [Capnocytophaga canis]|uniref:Uncharacterized protein n=1 Tax=Capnocytophaga canis TaxID=1848903 RepID=A0A0B7IHB1_9FLAO|nr:hypothetical protein [Capnocytophaga canis]CEN51301.1 conserved hypothetical protein [Capnocytophaga canis]
MNQYFNNEEQYTRVATFLANQGGRFGLTAEQAMRMKPTPSELYVNSIFSAGGSVPLLNGNSTQEIGVTNFDGNRLDAGRFFIIEAVTVQYGEAADTKKVWEVKYGDKMPEVLESSHLVLRQNGEVLVKLPISAIQNAKKMETFYRKLGALALIEPTQTVELTIDTPSGSSITTSNGSDKSFVRVLFKGFETYLKR